MTTTKENHALNNAIGHIESMVNDFKKDQLFEKIKDYDAQDQLRESILNNALSVQFRSDWFSTGENNLIAKEFRILISWGGPALRVIGELDEDRPVNPKLQYQDWWTPWTDLEITKDQQDALYWYCNCFYLAG